MGFESILGDSYNRPYMDDLILLQVDGLEMDVAAVFPSTVRYVWRK